MDGRSKIIDYKPRGAVTRLWTDLRSDNTPEVLLEGPAGTGKSRGYLEYMNWCCETYPGIRCLLIRRTRASLSQSSLVELEEAVLRPDHPSLLSPVNRSHREQYVYENGSVIVPGGMDQPTRTFSTQYDLIVYEEAIEGTKDQWEKLARANRNGKLPWQQMVAATNPGPPNHWLNKRALAGKMVRLKTYHRDNPVFWDAEREDFTERGRTYVMGKLRGMTGANLGRLYRGDWVAESGLIWPSFDSTIHVLQDTDERLLGIHWYFAAMDFGYAKPGCLGVWGVDDLGRMFCVAEVYRAKWTPARWARCVEEIYGRYPLEAMVADSADAGAIANLNEHLSREFGGSMHRIVRGANKKLAGRRGVVPGLNQVRMEIDGDAGGPRIFWVENRMIFGVDPQLEAAGQITCTTDEILSYQFAQGPEETLQEEVPARDSVDHGCDMTRYAVTWKGRRRARHGRAAHAIPGTYEHMRQQDPITRLSARELAAERKEKAAEARLRAAWRTN